MSVGQDLYKLEPGEEGEGEHITLSGLECAVSEIYRTQASKAAVRQRRSPASLSRSQSRKRAKKSRSPKSLHLRLRVKPKLFKSLKWQSRLAKVL